MTERPHEDFRQDDSTYSVENSGKALREVISWWIHLDTALLGAVFDESIRELGLFDIFKFFVYSISSK